MTYISTGHKDTKDTTKTQRPGKSVPRPSGGLRPTATGHARNRCANQRVTPSVKLSKGNRYIGYTGEVRAWLELMGDYDRSTDKGLAPRQRNARVLPEPPTQSTGTQSPSFRAAENCLWLPYLFEEGAERAPDLYPPYTRNEKTAHRGGFKCLQVADFPKVLMVPAPGVEPGTY